MIQTFKLTLGTLLIEGKNFGSFEEIFNFYNNFEEKSLNISFENDYVFNESLKVIRSNFEIKFMNYKFFNNYIIFLNRSINFTEFHFNATLEVINSNVTFRNLNITIVPKEVDYFLKASENSNLNFMVLHFISKKINNFLI